MRTKKTKIVKQNVTETTITCCFCGRKKEGEQLWDNGGCGDHEESEVSLTIWTKFPGGGSGEKIVIDICPQCFKERLIPWIKEQGGTIEEEEWEY